MLSDINLNISLLLTMRD